MACASVEAHRYAVLWRDVVSCFPGGILLQDPVGVLVPLPAGAPAMSIPLGFSTMNPPGVFSRGPATVGSLGADTLAAWPASVVEPPTQMTGIAGAWVGGDGAATKFSLGSADWASGFGPTVAAGAAGFLVAWADRTGEDATTLLEVRARRVTRADGALDADGGSLLATAGGPIVGGPAVGFDGTVWTVAWIETSDSGYDVRAVAVRSDGTVVDEFPRLLAAAVANVPPAISSTGDGRAVVLFVRSGSGGTFSVHALAFTAP